MRTVIINLGIIVTGDLKTPFAEASGILMHNGRITAIGTLSSAQTAGCDVVIDAAGCTAIPGLIDSHVHITFGDYTPRQQVVGYLESYLHGGTKTAITASEVHVPGRPKDPAGVKALALAARACFLNYRPGGMRVHAGSIFLEPGLTEADLEEVVAAGLWLAKAGFGAFDTPFDYAPLMRAARRPGMVTTMHTGGSSIPGSSGIWAEHVLASNPSVSFHVNGGPTAMPEAGFARPVNESDIALQLCTAGNLQSQPSLESFEGDASRPRHRLCAAHAAH
jgi:enamidase